MARVMLTAPKPVLPPSSRARLEALNTDHLHRMDADRVVFEASGLQTLLDSQDRDSRAHLVNAMRGAEQRFEMWQLKPKRILELGPGKNPDRDYLTLAFHGEIWSGVDVVEENAALHHGCYHMAIEELPDEWEGLFHVIYSRHVLEHVADPDAALRALRKVLAPNGIIGAVTPHQPDNEPAHLTQLPLHLWPDVYLRNGLAVVYGEVKPFRVEESHIVAIRLDWQP